MFSSIGGKHNQLRKREEGSFYERGVKRDGKKGFMINRNIIPRKRFRVHPMETTIMHTFRVRDVHQIA